MRKKIKACSLLLLAIITMSAGPLFWGTLTTKGDLAVWTGSQIARQGVGADATFLTANSAQTTGVQWRTIASTDLPLADSSSNAGAVNPYSAGTGVVYSAAYTPTYTSGTNISGSVTHTAAFYTRIGKIVIVTGAGSVALTSSNASSQIDVSLPVASNIGASTDITGLFVRGQDGSTDLDGTTIQGSAANDRAVIQFFGHSNGGRAFAYQFMYTII